MISEKVGLKDAVVSSVSIALVSLSIPIIFLLLKCNSEKLEKDEIFNQRYGVLFKGLKLNSGITYQFTTIYLVRRFLFAITLLTLENMPYFQVLCQIIMSEVLIWYLIKYQPYENFLENCIELVNEVTIALIFLFSQGLIHDLPSSFTAGDKENVGNLMISLITLCMIVNVYFFLQNMYRTLILAKIVPLFLKVREKRKSKAKIEDIKQNEEVKGKEKLGEEAEEKMEEIESLRDMASD